MKKQIANTRYRPFRYFLLFLFLGYFSSITLFPHIHTVDGIRVVHSHPYKSDAEHSHSTKSLILINFITHFTALISAIFISEYFRRITILRLAEHSRNHFTARRECCIFPRAPTA